MGDNTAYLVIGLSGTTNAGKTTLAEKIKQLFPKIVTICQDKYFLAPDDKRLEKFIVPEVNHANWEQFGALDMEAMMHDVEEWVAATGRGAGEACQIPILLIEGFLIFNHRELTSYFHKKYFLTIDRETCVERRSHRHYNPPDVPGYFEKVVWPMYLRNKEALTDQTDIVYLDGTEEQEKVSKQIESDIKQLITCHSRSNHPK